MSRADTPEAAQTDGAGMTGGDASTSGIDRRSALKKVAAAGAISWVAPTIISEKAHAVDLINGTCTAKCALPFDPSAVTLSNQTVLKGGCAPGEAPGQQAYIVDYAALVTYSGTCPCTGDNPVSQTIAVQGVGGVSGPGNRTFAVTLVDAIRLICRDRQGNCLLTTASIVIVVTVTGNCQAQTGRITLDSTTITNATGTQCIPALECPG